MIIFMFIGVVASILFLAGLVVSQGLDKRPNRALLLSMSMLGAWTIMIFGLQTEYGQYVEYSRLVFAVGGLSLLSLVWLVSVLLSVSSRARFVIGCCLAVVGALLFVMCMSHLVIASVALSVHGSSVPFPEYGFLAPAYMLVVVVSIASIVYMIAWGSTQEKIARRRQQVRIVGASIVAAITTAAVTNLVIPWLTGDAQSALYMTISILILMGGLTYAIIQHGLFDIKLATVRTIGYILTMSLLATTYAGIVYIASLLLLRAPGGVSSGIELEPAGVVLALFLALIFQPIKQFFDKLTEGVFYRSRYDSEAFYGRLSEVLTSELDLSKLMGGVAHEIGSTLKSDQSFLYVQWGHHHATTGTMGHAILSEREVAVIDAHTRGQDKVIVGNALSSKDDLSHVLSEHDIAIIVPLRQKHTMLGYLFLGPRRSGDYTSRDVKVLDTISNELVIAVQNALSMQEIREFNKTLQQRIEAATSELRASNEKLKQLDAAKDEFVSMASHQLRTPLTSVKGYISMVLEGDAGRITSTQRKLLGEAFMSSERMVHLISDFLNVSRLQTGKFVIDKSLVNLADVVREEVSALQATAEAHSLRLRYRKPANFPSLYIDEGKLRQVIMNFVDNAIFYSPDHSVVSIKLRVEDGCAVLTITDAGIGVPKEDQGNLFTKFFRAENARRQRPDGTGIGLFLAKKVISAHGGDIVFESIEGEGSTFGFRLPIKELSEPPEETGSSSIEITS